MKKPHLLIIRFSALGDVAMTVPVVSALAAQYPDLRITVLSRKFARTFFEDLAPNVGFMEADLKSEYKGLRGLNALYRRLKAKKFTAVADFHQVLRSDYLRMRFQIDKVAVEHINKHRHGKRQLTAQNNKKFVQQPTSFENYAEVLAKLGYPVTLQFTSIFPPQGGNLRLLPPEIGEKKAFEDLGIIAREEQKERELSAWIAADPERQAAWGDAIQTIAEVTEAAKPVLHAGTLLNETIARIEICTFGANMAVVPDYLEQMRKRNPDATIDEQQILDEVLEFLDDKYKDYDANVDREVAIALIDHYKANVDPADAIRVNGKSILNLDTRKFVDNLFKKSIFTSKEKLHAKPLSLKALASDPAVQLGKALLDALDPISEQVHELDAKATEASKAYTAALLKWQEGKPSYPDANSTCRFTYGTVKSYEPKDGVLYKHYTTLKGVMEKEDPDNYEFRVPARLKEIYQTKDYGQYANEDGEVVTCFLTNNDITGGNSGSPVMDADSNLIGLAFDGNWESMSSDVMFEPNLQRCICVDIRYVLLMVDKFAGAGYLLNEMNIVR